jgi:hypothetical protein
MLDPEEPYYLSKQGESFSTEFSFTWINPGPIEAGESIVPAKLSSPAARTFAALHLILGDLVFAEECLREADNLGIPDDRNLHSKALIFSGVITYARCFKSGVRALTLVPRDLTAKGAPFDESIHHYLIALRDKHIAHSVNDFEQCDAVAVMIEKPGSLWRDGSGIGVMKKQTVGISWALVREAISHINALRQFLESELTAQREALHAEFLANLAMTGKWEMAPITKLSDRSKVAERRK